MSATSANGKGSWRGAGVSLDSNDSDNTKGVPGQLT